MTMRGWRDVGALQRNLNLTSAQNTSYKAPGGLQRHASISSIGTSSRNYSTMTSWLAAFQAGGWVGECYNDSQFTAAVSFSGQATAPNDYIILRAATGQSFRDHGSAQTNPLAYDQSKGVGITISTAYTNVITIDAVDYITIDGLQIQQTASNGGGAIYNPNSGTPNCVVNGCIMETTGAAGIFGINFFRDGKFTNNAVIVQSTYNYPTITVAYGSAVIENCTIVRPSNFTIGGTGVLSNSGAIVKNCAIFGFSTSLSSVSASSDYNCSDTTLPTGTHNQASKTYANQFVTTTNSGRDFKTKTGADLLNNAVTDITNNPTAKDIVGTPRPQGVSWDIGAWEFISVGNMIFALDMSGGMQTRAI